MAQWICPLGNGDCWDHKLCEMAVNEPAALARLAFESKDNTLLSFVAEALVKAPWAIAKPALVHLAADESDLVIEGVAIALGCIDGAMAHAEIRECVERWRKRTGHGPTFAAELLDGAS